MRFSLQSNPLEQLISETLCTPFLRNFHTTQLLRCIAALQPPSPLVVEDRLTPQAAPHRSHKRVIDALYGGNASRWINHSCKPNCEAEEDNGRVFIKSLRKIKAGEELNYDYGLVIDAPYTRKLKAEYPCWCGAPGCRGTLLAPKRRR